jgi:hypothetical protein
VSAEKTSNRAMARCWLVVQDLIFRLAEPAAARTDFPSSIQSLTLL